MNKNCIKCNKKFEKQTWESKKYWGKKRFCSKECSGTLLKKGHSAWNKGMKGKYKMPESHRLKTTKRLLGHKTSLETRRKISESEKGKKISVETRLKLSLKNKGIPKLNFRGDKSGAWKGGITPINKAIRMSLEYKLWREAIFKRDKWTCRWCYKIGGKLNADHIKPFSLYPELRFALDNGRTLCVDCHKKTDTYGSKLKMNGVIN